MIECKTIYRKSIFLILSIFMILLDSCGLPENTITEEFQTIDKGIWGWKETKSYTFTVDDSTHYYNIYCGLRITGKYNYSNIWLIYELAESRNANNSSVNSLLKKQFQIELADQTGRWLGKGMSNLISYEQPLLIKTKLKKGNYTFKLSQNMREDLLSGVNDVGIKVEKAQPIL
ncbi:MAG: gliding motility lipoprotein GldH [Bacteroidetes bacterium]|nr:gliding motility lipoprotein GldH [Bacteroidota bacterium]